MLKMTMIGNLGKDAEVRDAAGQKVIAFNLAHSEKYTDRNGQQQERTQWVACSYWRQDGQTRVADYLKTGQKVYVEGFPSVRAYTTKDGQQAASLDLRVLSLELVGGKNDEGGQRNNNFAQPGNQSNPYPQPQQQNRPAEPAYNQGGYAPQAARGPDAVDDDLPF